MQFRPCIDIHNGKVKQIVGSSLQDGSGKAAENFVSEQDSAYFARLYAEKGLRGGHVILLNPVGSKDYEATKAQALSALLAAPGTLQAGGGITPENAEEFLEAGASHVIVTSYVFKDGRIDFERLAAMKKAAGRERLVLDVSCRRYEGGYFVCTDRWQKKTDFALTKEHLSLLAESCDEFLIHAVDVEGKQQGIEEEVTALLGEWTKENPGFYEKVTYAGGVQDLSDVEKIGELGRSGVNVTIGSALDLFGGPLALEEVLATIKNRR